MAMRLSLPASYSWQPQTIPRLANNNLTIGISEALTVVNGAVCAVRPYSNIDNYIPVAGTLSSAATADYSKYGRGIYFNGNSATRWVRASVPFDVTSKAASLLNEATLMALMVGKSNGAQQYFVDYHKSSGTNAQCSITSTYIGTDRIGWTVEDDSGTFQDQGVTTGYSLNTPNCVIGRRSKSLNISETFLNGSRTATTTCTNLGNTTLEYTTWGGERNTTRSGNGTVFLSALWLRCLTEQEISSLSTNPWQIFDYPSRPIILDTGAAAAGTSFPPMPQIQSSFSHMLNR